jgi:hypothetical protein
MGHRGVDQLQKLILCLLLIIQDLVRDVDDLHHPEVTVV